MPVSDVWSRTGLQWRWLLLLVGLAGEVEGQQSRPLQVDDLFQLEQLGPVAVSPDGRWLAVVVVRAIAEATHHRDFPFDMDRADIWLVARKGGARRNITRGNRDGSGYWNPVWSPDGQRLALLGLKPGSPVHPYVWSRADSTLRLLSDRAIDLRAQGEEGLGSYMMLWRNAETLICAVLPEGAGHSYYGIQKTRSYTRAPGEWRKAEIGIEPTASVLESGREVPRAERLEGALLAIDVVTRSTAVLGTGNFRQALLSPGRHVAVLAETGRVPPSPGRKIPYQIGDRYWDLWRTRLGILPLDGKGGLHWVSGVTDARMIAYDAIHSWSPDGAFLAVVGKADSSDETGRSLFQVAAASGTAVRIDVPLAVGATAWTGAGDLVVLARSRTDVSETGREDWWVIEPRQNGTLARNLTARMGEVPQELVRTQSRSTLLGITSGDVWSLDVHSHDIQNVTERLESHVTALAWPTPAHRRAGDTKDLLVLTDQRDLYRIRWAKARTSIDRLSRPSSNARVIEYDSEAESALFSAEERTGTYLWSGSPADSVFQLTLALNRQLAEITDARRMLVEYRGVDGDSLKALLILPVNYQIGNRCPLIVWVYGGLVVSDTTNGSIPLFEKQLINAHNLHLLPARGYAVLVPSMPLASPERGSDPFIDMPKGVVPAVDRVIDLGIADPARLGVMGHSYGGYSTLALVAYTHRFKAAVASAGLSDLVSLYGTFSAPSRYDPDAHEDLFQAALSESGQTRMGTPLWTDLWRYVRNSPIAYVERIQTPLMMIQGDIDYVPIQQGEEMFTALYRQGKEAKFVRYWGEGHVISSPANLRDMWCRIFDWFDSHLGTVPIVNLGDASLEKGTDLPRGITRRARSGR